MKMLPKSLKEFIDFINVITERPGMFEITNVNDLGLVILGYKNCRCLTSVEVDAIDRLFEEFYIFLNKEFEMKNNSTWVRLIRFISGENKVSIELFRVKFNQFLEASFFAATTPDSPSI